MEQLAQKTVSYFYDEEYANHSLGGCNPMRPHRVRLTNRLLEGYNMTNKMQVHRPRALDYEGLNYFHADGVLLLVLRHCESLVFELLAHFLLLILSSTSTVRPLVVLLHFSIVLMVQIAPSSDAGTCFDSLNAPFDTRSIHTTHKWMQSI